MTGIILLTLVLSAPPEPTSQSTTPAVSPITEAAPQTLAQWRAAVHDVLRTQATAKDIDQPAAVLRLGLLYRQLTQATELEPGKATGLEKKRLQNMLRGRLARLKEQVPMDLKLRLARVNAIERRAKSEKQPELLDKIHDDRAVLAQWQGALAQFAPPAAQGGGNNGGAMPDDGQRLVDVIQAVVTPDFWDVNGGPGAVIYYPSLHALIVRGTTETHENVAGLLDALRRAGN
ncbi:MAG: hypothetical protein K8T25_20595 [Planctomycetia bacterium]|nr:hypothetical protein [Planctomycetia bacterium]